MELSKNSIKLIDILCSDAEKLNAFVLSFKEGKAYDYCVSLIPEYTREEFEEMKETLNSKKEALSDDITEKISGGSLDDIEEVLSGWQQGEQRARPIANSISIMSRVLSIFKK